MVPPSAAGLGRSLLKYFRDSIKRVGLVLSAVGNTRIFWSNFYFLDFYASWLFLKFKTVTVADSC
jgi:hypothetical protein